MTPANFVVMVASAAVLAFATLLVLDKDYEDGLVGRVALSLIALAAFGRFSDTLFAALSASFFDSLPPRQPSGIAVMLWVGVAMFFARHLWRFRRWKKCGKHEWRKPVPAATSGKSASSFNQAEA